MDKIEILREWVKESHNIVAFTGAGVSTESGVKDFRSKDGLYSETWRPNDSVSTESGVPDFLPVWMGCTAKALTIRRRPLSAIAST